MNDIQTYLDYILSKVYGREVRQAIVDAINQCYADAAEGITPVITTEQIAGGTRFTVTVGSVSTSFDVMNGISPQVATANTASTMTDTDLIYVYTGSETDYVSGDWYYYDGTAWQDGGQYQSTVPAIDSTLTITGAAADAKKTGDEIADLKSAISQMSGMSEDVKVALLQIAQKVAYIDEDGQDYYDDLYDALYPPVDLVSISCVYTQDGTVYDTDSLDSLKSDLVVTAHYSDSTTATVTTYTLSGTLTAGTSTITVSYGGKTATFTVTVTHQTIPSGYTEYGYVYRTAGGSNTPTANVIQTVTYTDLNSIVIDFDFMTRVAKTTASAIIGGSAGSGNTNRVAIYVNNSSDTVSAWNHNANPVVSDISSVLQKTHVTLNPNSESPMTLTANESSVSIAWAATNTINQTLAYHGTMTTSQMTSQADICIGIVRIYSLSGVLLNEYIPCVRNYDNVIGIYDTVNSSFRTATNTALVTIGDESCVYAVGNWN